LNFYGSKIRIIWKKLTKNAGKLRKSRDFLYGALPQAKKAKPVKGLATTVSYYQYEIITN
jgi:hypothetical protein